MDLNFLDTAEPAGRLRSPEHEHGVNSLRDTEPKGVFCFLRGCDCVRLSVLCGTSRGLFIPATMQLGGSNVYTARCQKQHPHTRCCQTPDCPSHSFPESSRDREVPLPTSRMGTWRAQTGTRLAQGHAAGSYEPNPRAQTHVLCMVCTRS